MTPENWIAQARKRQDHLTSFVQSYHPASSATQSYTALPITAPNAEAVCEIARNEIRQDNKHIDTPPHIRFIQCLDRGEADDAYNILSDAWIGVPESRSCWSIRGFSEAVELLDDPPEPEEL